MTSDDNEKTEELAAALRRNGELVGRIHTLRGELWATQDEVDSLRATMKKGDDLRGPSWSERTECNDGRIWARPAADSREGWIRYFAGQVASGAAVAMDEINPPAIAAAALALWDDLESHFQQERADQMAIARAKREADAAQGKLWKATVDEREEGLEK